MIIICTDLSQYGGCWAYLVHLFTSFFILQTSICVYTHAYAFKRTYNCYTCLISLRIRKLIYTLKKYEKMSIRNIGSNIVKCIVKEVHALSSQKRMVESVSLYSKCSVYKKTKLTIKYVQTRKEPLCIYTAQRASFLQT